MNGIDNLALYKTVDELQESKNSIQKPKKKGKLK